MLKLLKAEVCEETNVVPLSDSAPKRCSSCGGEWFRLDGGTSSPDSYRHGAVTMSASGRITGYFGAPVCCDCGAPA